RTAVGRGTSTGLAGATGHSVTATNTGGSTTATVTITVSDVVPSTLTYSANPATYTKGTAITANSATSTGGAVVSYSVSPALPTRSEERRGGDAMTGTLTGPA